MSRYLVPRIRCYSPTLANLIGLHEAILVHHIYRICEDNEPRGEMFCWWSASIQEIADLVHLSPRSAQNIVKRLEDIELIVSRQSGGIDRTKQYRINLEAPVILRYISGLDE